MQTLTLEHHGDIVLWEDVTRPYGVRLAFSERSGGVSSGPFASLNLSSRCGDELSHVQENRLRVVRALVGEEAYPTTQVLAEAHQVHGTRCVVLTDASPQALSRAQQELIDGADAIVCTVEDVCPLLCFADCVPLIFVARGGFAIAHSGWRGTLARIASNVLDELMRATGSSVQDVQVYIGPHIQAADYPVSRELLTRFVASFGTAVEANNCQLDLAAAIQMTLVQAGVLREHIVVCPCSTAACTDRFFSYRASGGVCGRHGALACMSSSDQSIARKHVKGPQK